MKIYKIDTDPLDFRVVLGTRCFWITFANPDEYSPDLYIGEAPSGASIYYLPHHMLDVSEHHRHVLTNKLALLVVHGLTPDNLQSYLPSDTCPATPTSP